MFDIIISIVSIFLASLITFLITNHFARKSLTSNSLNIIYELIMSSMNTYGQNHWKFTCLVNLSLIKRYNKKFLYLPLEDNFTSISDKLDNGEDTDIVEAFRNLFDKVETYEDLIY